MLSHTSIPMLTLKATVPSQKVQYLQHRSCCNKQSKQQRHRSEWLNFACSTRKKVITWEWTKAVTEIHIPETSNLDFWIFAGHHWCLISQLQLVALGLVINFSLLGHQGEFLCTYPKWQKISLPSKYMCTYYCFKMVGSLPLQFCGFKATVASKSVTQNSGWHGLPCTEGIKNSYFQLFLNRKSPQYPVTRFKLKASGTQFRRVYPAHDRLTGEEKERSIKKEKKGTSSFPTCV
jgi:hypothetical protein